MPGLQESCICPEESVLGGAVPGHHSLPALPGGAHQGSDGGRSLYAEPSQSAADSQSICITCWELSCHETTVFNLDSHTKWMGQRMFSSRFIGWIWFSDSTACERNVLRTRLSIFQTKRVLKIRLCLQIISNAMFNVMDHFCHHTTFRWHWLDFHAAVKWSKISSCLESRKSV